MRVYDVYLGHQFGNEDNVRTFVSSDRKLNVLPFASEDAAIRWIKRIYKKEAEEKFTVISRRLGANEKVWEEKE